MINGIKKIIRLLTFIAIIAIFTIGLATFFETYCETILNFILVIVGVIIIEWAWSENE